MPAAASATALPEEIKENTTLTAAGNPYTGNPTIKAGVTLTVKPGVQFALYNINVDGTLKVEGTAEEPVVFTSAKEEAPGEWCSIDFRAGSGASVVDHAVIKYGGGCGGGAIRVNGSASPRIINSAFSKNSSYGVNVSEGGAPEVADNMFFGSGVSYAAAGTKTGEVNIHGNFVEGGPNGIIANITSTGSVVGKNLGGNTVIK
ncbi:MAG TPA: hypothetical protein VFY48_02380, partial [Solirubrobacterales bacterium]|nr:hypothetical protein [Solirubrobacterales bacterium]